MASDGLRKNSDGSFTRVVNGKSYDVAKNDPRHARIEKEYNDNRGGSSGGSSGNRNSGGSSGGSSGNRNSGGSSGGSSGNRNSGGSGGGSSDQYTLRYGANGSIIKTQNGKSYEVSPNDSLGRYDQLKSELDRSSGGGGGSRPSSGSSGGGISGGSGGYSSALGSDGKYYATGATGKQFVYNKDNGNIAVTGLDGKKTYYMIGDSGYQAAYDAMVSDTGGRIGGSGGGYHQEGLVNQREPNSSQSPPDWLTAPQEEQTVTMDAQIQEFREMEEYYKQQMAEAQAQNDAALVAALQAALARLEAQKPEIMRQAEAANRAAHVAYLQAADPFGVGAEAAHAIGLGDSGYAESSQISLGNAYQGSINENEQTKAQILSELEQAKQQAMYEGDIQRANAAADYAQQIASQGLSNANTVLQARLQQEAQRQALAQQQLQNRMQWQQWQDQLALNQSNQQFQEDQWDWQKQQYGDQQAQAATDQLWQQAQVAAQLGFYEPLAQLLGTTPEAIASAYRQQVLNSTVRSGRSAKNGDGIDGWDSDDDAARYAADWASQGLGAVLGLGMSLGNGGNLSGAYGNISREGLENYLRNGQLTTSIR